MQRDTVVLLLLFVTVTLVSANYPGNYALSFDGIDDIVTVPHTYQDLALNDFWTMEAWIKPAATQTYWQLNIVGYPQRHPNMNYCGPSNSQCTQGDPIVQLRAATGSWITVVGDSTKVAPDKWHHFAGTWNNNTLSLYLDGVLDTTAHPYDTGYTEALTCLKSTMYSCDAGLQIGGNYFRMENGIFNNQYFRGLIDEVRVWKFSRSVDDIKKTMNTALVGSEPGLLYYWRFDDHGKQVARSSALDVYALLGGGRAEAEPQFVLSDAPVSAPPSGTSGTPAPIIVEKNSAGAVTAGALIGVFCLLGGVAFGVFVGYRIHGKRYLSL